MHIYFSGIGGAGIGPLAMVAKQAGYEVSGSDKQDSEYIHYLRDHAITNIHIGQQRDGIRAIHEAHPIDWFVYSSALPLENPDAPELHYCHEQNIKTSKRDQLINTILTDKHLRLVAIAGTHGKTTTTALVIWLLLQFEEPISYLLPAKTSFAQLGTFDPDSRYFIYEADEFDRNFLAFQPAVSLISGVSWDHHEIFPTREDYQEAFREFITQSTTTFIWQEDSDYLGLEGKRNGIHVLKSDESTINKLGLLGKYNRLDAWLAITAVRHITKQPLENLVKEVNRFPGLQRRMEQIVPNLFSDYAHTPEKIRGAMSVAMETAAQRGQKLIVLYEPLTNRRQHYIMNNYKDCFNGAEKVYWLPSYLARENPRQRIITPDELISHLDDPRIAKSVKLGPALKQTIQKHLNAGDMVVAMAGGGGGSLDDWLRQEFQV
jgi:UDP-N-acetylmuramate--alanine ligase